MKDGKTEELVMAPVVEDKEEVVEAQEADINKTADAEDHEEKEEWLDYLC